MGCWEGWSVGWDVLLGGIGQQLYTLKHLVVFKKKGDTLTHTNKVLLCWVLYLVYLFYSIFIWLIHFTFTYLMKGRLQKSEDIFQKGSLGQFNFLNFPHFLFFIKVFLTDWLCWLFCCYLVVSLSFTCHVAENEDCCEPLKVRRTSF